MYSYLLVSIATGLIGRYVAKEKGRNAAEGFLLGFLFSLMGLFVEAIMPSKIHSEGYLSRKRN